MTARRLRIAWDNSIAGKDQAGTGVYASMLLAALRERPDMEITALDEAGSGWPKLLWHHLRLPRLVSTGGFDILHEPVPLLPFLNSAPSVITVLDLTPLLFPEHFSFKFRSYFRWTLPQALRRAKAVVCISEHSRQDLLKAFPIDPAKVHTVYPGVDHARFHSQVTLDRAWAKSAGIEKPYVLHVGTLFYRKNIPVLLRAVARMGDAGTWGDRQLVVGGAEMPGLRGAEDIYKTIDELKLKDIVVLTGRVPVEQLAGLYAGAEALVMPSLYEGFGFPVVEAMACGTPVICSNVSSLPEVAGMAAITFDPQNDATLAVHLERVLSDEKLREEMQRKGLEQARAFTWQRAAEQTEAIYRQILR